MKGNTQTLGSSSTTSGSCLTTLGCTIASLHEFTSSAARCLIFSVSLWPYSVVTARLQRYCIFSSMTIDCNDNDFVTSAVWRRWCCFSWPKSLKPRSTVWCSPSATAAGTSTSFRHRFSAALANSCAQYRATPSTIATRIGRYCLILSTIAIKAIGYWLITGFTVD